MAGKGRAPCCDKSKVKKGPWSPAEDLRLITFIQKHGHSNWRALPQQAGLLRCGKSCRLRWINYLRPDVKRGSFSPEEEETIIRLQKSMGNKWSKIASQLPGRTDNEIKNVWNTHLKKKLGKKIATCDQNQKQSEDSLISYSSSSSPSSSSCISYGDMSVDKGPGIQEAEEFIARETDDQKQYGMPARCKEIGDESKEESESPGHSSFASNMPSLMSIEEVSRPVEETNSYERPSQVQNLTSIEVSHEEIEIPFDTDVDFWSMLDTLNPIQPCEVQPQEPEDSKLQGTNFEAEYKNWLKYLENELGLAGGTDSDCPHKAASQELVTKTSNSELMFRSEINPSESYFPMWPSPTQDFGI